MTNGGLRNMAGKAAAVAAIGAVLVGGALTGVDAKPGNGVAKGQTKTAICHYDKDTATYTLLNLPAPALAAHQKNHKSDVAPTEGACPTPTPPAQ